MTDARAEDRSIPFLMHQIVGRVERLVNKWARPLGLKIEGVRVLFRLLGGERSVNELARLTGVEISTLSRLLGRMSAMGLLTRRRDPADARSVIVSLTDTGRKLALEHQPVYFRDYEEVLLGGFTGAEAQALRQHLIDMIDNLDAAGDETKPGAGETAARAAGG
ncbi:MAG: MarR family winged helix-turn-helix transcriptional regulator [Alphaproteobacteria bacterium]|nr:MarR family winged helix-turn-helix transcriptional regulator [Alphaproteobacteria bacterium]